MEALEIRMDGVLRDAEACGDLVVVAEVEQALDQVER